MANFKEEILLLKIVADVSKSAKEITGLADALDKPVSSIAELKAQANQLKKALEELPQEGTKGFQELSRAIGAVKFIDTDDASKELTNLFDTLNQQLGQSKAKLKQFNDELGRPGTADANIRLLADAFGDIKGVLDKTPQSVKEVEDRLKTLQTFLKRIPAEGTDAFEQLSTEIANLAGADGNLDNASAGISALRENITQEVVASNEALKQFRVSLKAPLELPEGSLNALRQDLIGLRKEFDNLSATDREGDFGQQLLIKIQKVDAEVRQLEESTGRAQRNVGAYGQAIREALDEYRTIPEIQAELKKLGAEQNRLTQTGNKIADALKKGGVEAEKLADILRAQGRTGKDSQDILQKELLETQKALQDVNNTAAQSNRQLGSLQADFKSATAKAGSFVKGALIAVGADLSFQAIKDAVGSVIRTFAEFEDRVATLAGVLGKPIERIKELRQNAEALGAATKFSASQVAELQTEFARIGFNEQQILDATGATLALAQATGETLANSAAVAGATLQGFGLDASETQRVTDVMAKSFNNTALDLDGFKQGMKQVAPIARAANISLEETTAILGALSNAGIKGELAGTSVKNILAGIGDETSGLSKFLGVTVNNFDELTDALSEASKRSDNFARANKFLGEQVRPAVLALLNNADALRTLRAEYDNAAGAAQRTADIQSKTLTFAIEEFKGSLEGLYIAIGSRLAPAFTGIIKLGTSFVNILQSITAVPISESLENEQVAINVLVQQLLRAEEGTDRYKSLLEELNTIYPEVIDKIDKEEAGIQALLKPLSDAVTSDEDRLKAITDLNRQYPDFITQLTSENSTLAELIPKLTDSNVSQEDKLKLVKDLKTEYPDFLAFVNENTTFEGQLKNALNLTNKEYVNRIILQKQREELESSLVAVGEKRARQIEYERAIEDLLTRGKIELVKINGDYANSLDLNSGTLQENTQKVIDALSAETGLLQIGTPRGKILAKLEDLQIRYGYALDNVAKKTEAANQQQAVYDDVMKRLGISTGNAKDEIESLRLQIKELQDQQKKTKDPILLNIIDQQIKKLNDRIVQLGGDAVKGSAEAGAAIGAALGEGVKKGTDKALPGTIRYMREALGELKKQIDNTPDLGKRVELIEKASDIEKKIDDAERLLKAFQARNQDKEIQIKLSEKDKLNDQIKKLNAELDDAAKDRRVKIEGQIDDVMNKLLDLQKEIKDTFGDSGSIELQPKFEEYKTIKAQLDDLQDRAQVLETPREIQLKADIGKIKADITDLNEKAATFSSLADFTVTPDFTRLSALQGSLERLNEELRVSQEQSKIDVQVQTQEAQSRLSVLAGELANLTGQDITPKLKQVEQLKAQLAELKAQLDADVPEERELIIKASISAAEQLLGKLDGEIDQLRNKEVRLPILTDQLVAASKEVDALTAKLQTAASADKNRILIDITAAQAKVEQLQDEIFALADEPVNVEVDIIGLSDSEVAKLFDTLIKGKKGLEEAIGIGAKAALEQQLSALAQSERATLQSLSDISDATDAGFAQRSALEAQLTDIQKQQEQTRLRFALAATQEGTDERRKAILDLLNFELSQTLATAKATRTVGQQLTEQEFLERKNAIAQQLAQVEGIDQASKDKRAALEKELTQITLQEEIRRKEAAISGIDAQLTEQEALVKNTALNATTRSEAEAKIAELQTERLKLQGEILDTEVELTKDSVDRQIDEYSRLEQQRQELRDAGLQVASALIDAALSSEKAKVEANLAAQQQAIDRRYADETRLAGNNAELKAKIDAKYQAQKDAAEKAAARKRKEIAVTEAIINIALAIIKALPNPIAATLAGVLGGIQLAVIESQQFAKGGPLDMVFRMLAAGGGLGAVSGGNIPDKGMISGKRHSQGGVKALYNGRPIEVEGGEGTTRIGKRRWIFNRGVMQDPVLRPFAMQTHTNTYNPMLDQIAGFINHLGLSRMKFAGGGSIGYKPMSYHIVPPPKYFATGGILDPVASSSTSVTNSILRAMLSVLESINLTTEDIGGDTAQLLINQAQGNAQASRADKINAA